MNCVLIACALDDWNEAETWRLTAEQEYHRICAEVKKKDDKLSLPVLEDLRVGLDKLDDLMFEALTGHTKEEIEGCGDEAMTGFEAGDDLLEDEPQEVAAAEQDMFEVAAGHEFEDAEAVAEAENEDEVAANQIDLPSESANPDIEARKAFSRSTRKNKMRMPANSQNRLENWHYPARTSEAWIGSHLSRLCSLACYMAKRTCAIDSPWIKQCDSRVQVDLSLRNGSLRGRGKRGIYIGGLYIVPQSQKRLPHSAESFEIQITYVFTKIAQTPSVALWWCHKTLCLQTAKDAKSP